jgi:large subunit ribosomal protein L32
MPNPKRRHSSTRRDKRRTHQGAAVPTLTTCQATGELHLRHRAIKVGEEIYHNGKLLVGAKNAE